MTRTQRKRWEEAKATCELLERQLRRAQGRPSIHGGIEHAHDKSAAMGILADWAGHIRTQMVAVDCGLKRFITQPK